MKPTMQQHNAFLAGELLPGVRFRHNDYVKIVDGPYLGDTGSLISVEDLGPDPQFLVELESRRDALILQSALVLVEPDSKP